MLTIIKSFYVNNYKNILCSQLYEDFMFTIIENFMLTIIKSFYVNNY